MMQTRCPACASIFRVTPGQLKAKHGKVRCGDCQQVFNALDALVEDAHGSDPVPAFAVAERTSSVSPVCSSESALDAATALPKSDDAGEQAEPSVNGVVAAEIIESLTTFSPTIVHDVAPETPVERPAELQGGAGTRVSVPVSVLQEDVVEVVSETDVAEQPEIDAVIFTPMFASSPDPALEHSPSSFAEPSLDRPAEHEPYPIEPSLHEAETTNASRHPWWWAFACLLVMLVLLAQLALNYRIELAMVLPESKPWLEAACTQFDCDVSLPHKVDLLSIEASDLHPDPQHKEQLQLTATLKNRASFAQTYPYLELTLTDTIDQAVLRKVLMPSEYLAKSNNVVNGFAANGEISVNLALQADNATNISAAGYRLYLFYP